MPTDDPTTLQAAREHAGEALEVLQRLKTGSWESVQALALLSIAESLLVLSGDRPTDSPGAPDPQ